MLSRITIAPGVSSRTPHATRRRVRPLEPPARGTTTEHHGGSRFRPLHAAPRAFRAVEGQGEARHQGEMRRARGVHGKQDRGRRRGGRPQGAPPRGTLLRVQLQGHPPPHQVRAKETRAAARDRGSARNARSSTRHMRNPEETQQTRATSIIIITRVWERPTSSTDIPPPLSSQDRHRRRRQARLRASHRAPDHDHLGHARRRGHRRGGASPSRYLPARVSFFRPCEPLSPTDFF